MGKSSNFTTTSTPGTFRCHISHSSVKHGRGSVTLPSGQWKALDNDNKPCSDPSLLWVLGTTEASNAGADTSSASGNPALVLTEVPSTNDNGSRTFKLPSSSDGKAQNVIFQSDARSLRSRPIFDDCRSVVSGDISFDFVRGRESEQSVYNRKPSAVRQDQQPCRVFDRLRKLTHDVAGSFTSSETGGRLGTGQLYRKKRGETVEGESAFDQIVRSDIGSTGRNEEETDETGCKSPQPTMGDST